MLIGSTSINQLWINLATATVGTAGGGITASLVSGGPGAWQLWKVVSREVCSTQSLYLRTAIVDHSTAYAGDGREAFHVYFPDDGYGGVTQIRAANIADKIGAATIAQAAAGAQPLFWETTQNGIIIPHRPIGIENSVFTSNAAVLALLGGDDPAFTMVGVFGGQGNAAGPLWAADAGVSHYEQPIMLRGAGAAIRTRRRDGVTLSEPDFAGSNTDVFLTPKAYAVICNTDRSRELWVDNVLVGTATLADLGPLTLTTARLGYYTLTTLDEKIPDTCLIPGQLPGATAAARYANVAPWVARLKAKYNV
jgi:hypothetical protein